MPGPFTGAFFIWGLMNTSNRSVRFLLWCLIWCVEAMSVILPGQATAQVVSSNAATAAINAIVTGAGVYASGSASALAQQAIATASGRAGQVAVTAASAVAASRLTGLAVTALRLGTAVGVAALVIPWIYQQSGYQTCPPPDFFCKTVTDYDKNTVGWICNGYADGSGTLNTCASFYVNSYNTGGTTSVVLDYISVGSDGKSGTIGAKNCNPTTGNCNYFRETVSRNVAQVPITHLAPATDTDMQSSVAAYAGTDQTKLGQLYKAEMGDKVAGVHVLTDPVTLTAPPLTLPSVVTNEQVANADGTTSTKVTTQTTKVTPTQTGTTLADAQMTYPQVTTTTVQLTNNSTGTITNSTATQTDTAAPVAPPLQMPTDYNREDTQQKILKTLDGTGVPTATIDGASDLTGISTQRDVGKTSIDGITPQSLGLPTSWFPTIPTATCVNPQVPNPITHALVPVEICEPVNIFGKFINGVICFFAIVGSVRQVQSALKA